jgi:hypothetical protein
VSIKNRHRKPGGPWSLARQTGATKYATDEPCPKCGSGVRYTSSRGCVPCSIQCRTDRKALTINKAARKGEGE